MKKRPIIHAAPGRQHTLKRNADIRTDEQYWRDKCERNRAYKRMNKRGFDIGLAIAFSSTVLQVVVVVAIQMLGIAASANVIPWLFIGDLAIGVAICLTSAILESKIKMSYADHVEELTKVIRRQYANTHPPEESSE